MSLKLKTIVGVAAIEAVFLILLVWQAMQILTLSNQQALETRAQETVGLFGTQVENALIATDLATLNEMVDQLMAQGNIEYVRILDQRGILASAGVPEKHDWNFQRDLDFGDIHDGMLDVDYQVFEEDIYLGTIQLGISTTGLSFLISESKTRLIGIALAELFMVALVSWILGCYLTRTLSHLTRQAQRLSKGEMVEPLPVNGRDELAVTVQSFNDMVEKLAQAREEDAIKSAVYEASLDAMITLNKQGNIIEFSSAAELIFGWRREDIIGKKVEETLVPEELIDSHLARRKALLSAKQYYGQGARRETVMLTRAGERIPVEVSSVIFKSQKNTYFTAFVRNISEQKNNQAQLIAAKETAELASQAKSRFLSHMSHEIRSPLNAVMGILQLLELESLSASQRRLLTIADTAGSSLLAVINEILDFSRIEAGNLHTDYATVDLADMTSCLLTTLESKLDTDQVELFCQIENGVPCRAEFDVDHTIQVIRNLVDNAIKFTDKGLIRLKIALVPGTGQTSCLAISIHDTGRGIPAAQLKDVFHEFEQVHAREDTRAGGIGLGLAIVKRLVVWMGGTVDVSSTPNLGSVFRFTVPLRSFEMIRQATPPPLQFRRVILVTGNEALQQAIEECVQPLEVALSAFASLAHFKASQQERQPTSTEVVLIDEAELPATGQELDWYQQLSISKVRLTRLGQDQSVPCSEQESVLYKPLSYQKIERLLRGQACDEAATPSQTAAVTGSHNRILIVEDIEANRIVLGGILTKSGYQVDHACNGVEALQALEVGHYDIVLMDLHMPVMNGIAAVTRLRACPGTNQHIPVVALTANAEKSEMQRCLAAGMNDFISKPFFTKNLLAVINRQVYQHQQLHDTPPEAAPDDAPGHAASVARQAAAQAELDARLLHKATLEKLAAETSLQALPRMLNSFIAELTRRMDDLDRALESNNPQELGSQAHALKSSSAVFGALALQQAAQQLEQLCYGNAADFARVISATQELMLLIRQTLECYRNYMQSMAAE
jgi:PAS domain S-box-containing protein